MDRFAKLIRLSGIVFAFLLSACLLSAGLTSRTLAAEEDSPSSELSEEEKVEILGEGVDEDTRTVESASDNEELYASYLDKIMSEDPGLALRGPAHTTNSLTGLDAAYYPQVLSFVKEVASGSRSSTVVQFDLAAAGITKTSWTAGDLGISSIVDSDGKVTEEAVKAARSRLVFDTDKMTNALQFEIPYELFWYARSCHFSWSYSYGYNSTKGEYVLSLSGNVTYTFYVWSGYQAGNNTTVDSSGVARAKRSAEYARTIVSKYSSYSDYAKLKAYKDEICSLTSYNNAAAGSSNAGSDPYQLVYVFDQDPSTNVVCEGYAKAFQYLFNLSSFSGDISCITVSGYMDGGAHRWNIVRYSDMKNYLVDVTNCDTGTIGESNGLFMVTPTSGSVNGGYYFNAGGKSILYTYKDSTLSVFSTETLAIGSTVTAPYFNKFTATQHVIAGQTATFTVYASGTWLTYQWQYSTDGGATWKNCTSNGYNKATYSYTPSISSNGRKIRCVITDANGLTATSDVANLSVLGFSKQPKSVFAADGSKAAFSVTAVGDGVTYQWMRYNATDKEWVNWSSTGSASASMSFTMSKSYDGYWFCCVIKDAVGNAVSSESVQVKLLVAPKITTQPASATAALNATVNFTVKASGTNLSYQWQYSDNGGKSYSNSTMSGAKSATLPVKGIEARNGLMFRCIVKNSLGSVTSNAVTLTVSGVKPTIRIQPVSVTAVVDGTAKFTVKAAGSGLSYQWQYSSDGGKTYQNTTLSGYSTATLTVKATSARSGNYYRCVVKNAKGSVTSSGAKLTAMKKPTISTQPSSATVALNKTVNFTVTAAGTSLSYQWQYSSDGGKTWQNSTMSGAKTAKLPVKGTEARNGLCYRVVVKNAVGSVTSGKATLTVSGVKPVIRIAPASAVVALNNTAKFTVKAAGTGLSYQWQYSSDGGKTWQNSTMDGAKTATLPVKGITARNGLRYRCKVTNSYGSATSSSAKLTVMIKPSISTQPSSATVALNGTVNFTVKAAGTSVSYQWQYSADNGKTWQTSTLTGAKTAKLPVTGTASRNGLLYRVVVKNTVGSATSSSARLTVSGVKPTIRTQPVSATAVVNNTVNFTVKAAGTGLSYQWQYSTDGGKTWQNSTMDGAKTATLPVKAIASRNGIYYRCVVKNSYGSTTSSSAKFTVITKPVITTQPKAASAALNTTVKFTVKASGAGLSYQWQYSSDGGKTWQNSTMDGAKTATLPVKAIAARNGIYYRCVVKNSYGSTTSSAVKLTVK